VVSHLVPLHASQVHGGLPLLVQAGDLSAGHRYTTSNCGDPEIIKVGSNLTDLYSRRIEADYRLGRLGLKRQHTVQTLVEQGRRMIEQLEACRTGERRVQIIQGIEAYRQRISS
jgi:hypothetical protein